MIILEMKTKNRDELLRYVDDNKSFDIGNRSIAIKKAIQKLIHKKSY